MLMSLLEQIFVFALRAYDRINKTPALEELESKADVNYQDIQRGIAESIMSESVHPAIGKEGDKNEKSYDTDSGQKQEKVQKLEKFEKQVEQREQMDGQPSKDSVAHVTMLNGGKMVDQPWEGDLENEKANIVQEELYVHGKVCIVDDRTVICGSANINDRVSQHLPRSLTRLNRTNQTSPNSARTTANWPSSWKTKTQSTAQWTANPTAPPGSPQHCADSSGASTWASYPRKNTTQQASQTHAHQTYA